MAVVFTGERRQRPYRHGTRSMYVKGCRCEDCRTAIREYERERTRLHLYGRYRTPYVDAAESRDRLHALTDLNVGLKAVAMATGVPHGCLVKIFDGQKRVRRETAAAIFAKTADEMRADGAKAMPWHNEEAWEKLHRLRAAGYSKAAIGRALFGEDAPIWRYYNLWGHGAPKGFLWGTYKAIVALYAHEQRTAPRLREAVLA